jgi:hypothetical protein
VDARALEHREVLHVEAAVPGAAGDHHGARPHPFVVREAQLEPLAVAAGDALEVHDLVRDRHLRAELLGLGEGAGHQRHPGDAGRKPEIVLDARRRARLPSERAGVDDDDR